MLQENIQSEEMSATMSIAKLILVITIINHIIACLWYWLTTFDETNWMTRAEMEDASVIYLYTTSMHWSVTQFTPASMEIVPANWRERTFTIFVIIGAMVIFSSFVSSITNTMNHLRTMNQEQRKEFWKLQQYFVRQGISVGLCIRIRKHLDHHLVEKQKHIKEADIPLLKHLSEPMQVELHYEVFAPLVRQHPLFEAYDDEFSHSMTRICHRALDQVSISQGDVLFSRGENASQMYFIRSGMMRYTLGYTEETFQGRTSTNRSAKTFIERSLSDQAKADLRQNKKIFDVG